MEIVHQQPSCQSFPAGFPMGFPPILGDVPRPKDSEAAQQESPVKPKALQGSGPGGDIPPDQWLVLMVKQIKMIKYS